MLRSSETRAPVLPPPKPRCDASRSMAASNLSSSSFETRARLFALAAPSRMRAPQDEDEPRVSPISRYQTALLVPATQFLRPGFCSLASLTPIEGGGAPPPIR